MKIRKNVDFLKDAKAILENFLPENFNKIFNEYCEKNNLNACEIKFFRNCCSFSMDLNCMIEFLKESKVDNAESNTAWGEAQAFVKALIPTDIQERFNEYCNLRNFNHNERLFFREYCSEAFDFNFTMAILKNI